MYYLLFAPLLLPAAAPNMAEETHLALPLDNPVYIEPAQPWADIQSAQPDNAAYVIRNGVTIEQRGQSVCLDTITEARAEAGLPFLQRETVSPDNPQLIYAVDRREDGCAVMVMKGNPSDIRPLPNRKTGGPLLLPADGDQ